MFDINDFWNDYLDHDSDHETLAEYWQAPDVDNYTDYLHEWAEGQVPVYNTYAVQEWLDKGLPEVDDPGLVEGVTDPLQMIRVALYCHYLNEAYDGYGYYYARATNG